MTIQRGDKTEAIVQAELVKRDFLISTPFGGNCIYDLILDRGNVLEKVQIKTGRMRDGKVIFNAYSWNDTCEEKKKTYEEKIDSFIVYCYENDKLYYIPIEEVTTNNKMSLRIEEADFNHPSINWADNYELDRKI